MRCIVTDYPGDETSLEEGLLAAAGVETFVSPSPDPADWETAAAMADAIMTRHAPIGSTTIERLERCRVIARYGTGYDNIDVVAARRRGIVVTNVPDYCIDEVAEHTMALLLMASRQVAKFRDAAKNGWTPSPLPVVERLSGKTLGLLGCGRIGSAVAQRAQAFKMRVIAYDPHAASLPAGVESMSSIVETLTTSNIVSLHAPLMDDTHHMLDAERLGMLPRGAIVLNVARGGLLDLDAAVTLVRSRHLAAVAVDVTEVEPLPMDHPARECTDVIITPHVGYYSTTSVVEAKRRTVEEVLGVLGGDPPRYPVLVD